MKRPLNYASRIMEIQKDLETKTLGEIEESMGISRLDYTGIGIGYNFQLKRPKTMKEARQDISVSGLGIYV